MGAEMGLGVDEGVFERFKEEANVVGWSSDTSTREVPGGRESLLLWGIAVPSGPETVIEGL